MERRDEKKPLRRILLFGKQKKKTRTTRQLVRAFQRAGCAVRWINPYRRRRLLGRRLGLEWMKRSVRRFRPDALISWTHDLPIEIAESVTIPIAAFYPDVYRPPDARLEAIAKRADAFFITNRGQLETLRSRGARNPLFLSEACDSIEHHRVRPAGGRYACDVAFVGRPYFQERVELIRHLTTRFPVTAFGTGWKPAPGITIAGIIKGERQMAKLCASAKVLVGIDCVSDIELCFSNRTWLTLGCGGFLVTRYVPKLEEFFRDGEHIVWYKTYEECADKIAWYLPREDERRRISTNGCALVHEKHTYDHRVERILAVLGEVPQDRALLGSPERSAASPVT